jgi:hypothetical protein
VCKTTAANALFAERETVRNWQYAVGATYKQAVCLVAKLWAFGKKIISKLLVGKFRKLITGYQCTNNQYTNKLFTKKERGTYKYHHQIGFKLQHW